MSKISINSGTYHGGKVLPDGKLAPVNVDYALLETISTICREEYGMGGAVQHGASTLPGSQLAKFPATGAVEIHLALGFNNLIFDHPRLPAAIKDQIRDYVFANHAAERKPAETDAQFLYNTRKKAWKAVKKPFWEMPAPDADRHHALARGHVPRYVHLDECRRHERAGSQHDQRDEDRAARAEAFSKGACRLSGRAPRPMDRHTKAVKAKPR